MVSALAGVIAVSPVKLVMSLLAPEAAAPRLVRAFGAVVAPVPPWPTDSAVVRLLRLVISLLAPDAAAPKLVRAFGALVAPVPPFATLSAVVSVKPAKVGELDTAKFCGADSVIVLPTVVTMT